MVAGLTMSIASASVIPFTMSVAWTSVIRIKISSDVSEKFSSGCGPCQRRAGTSLRGQKEWTHPRPPPRGHRDYMGDIIAIWRFPTPPPPISASERAMIVVHVPQIPAIFKLAEGIVKQPKNPSLHVIPCLPVRMMKTHRDTRNATH